MIGSSVHAQVLGSSYDSLPALLRGVHDERLRKEFSGRCSIQSGRNWLARIIALFASLPRRSHEDIAVHVVIERRDGSEISESKAAAHSRRSWTDVTASMRVPVSPASACSCTTKAG